MSRRRVTKRRKLTPDAKFGDVVLARFINYVMRKGKKSTAERIVYDAFDMIEKKTGQKGLDVFKKALDSVKPTLEVASRRVGGATYQIPIEVRPDRRMALAMRWIASFARARSEKTMAERLAAELMLAARNEGSAIKKREDTHRMAEANKAFAHFRW
jgi:small subunit ribosomal protein S7